MKTMLTTLIGLALAASVIHAAEPALEATPPASRLYFDAGASVTTTKFADDSYGYFVGGGFQLTPVWSVEARVEHAGFNWEGRGVSDVSFGLTVGSPLQALPKLRPYGYARAGFELEQDAWHIDPGAGLEFSFSKHVSVFGELGLRATLDNRYDFGGRVGGRFRF